MNSSKAAAENTDSRIIRVGPGRRVAHFLSLLATSTTTGSGLNETRTISPLYVYAEISAWLAWYHLNNPAEHILPAVRQRLANCDIHFTLQLRDTEFSPLYGARQLLQALAIGSPLTKGASNPYGLLPIAMVGATQSAESVTVSYLGSAYDVAQVSALSTAGVLDNKVSHPLFARTVPSTAGDAQAAATYFQALGITHVSVVYVADDYGSDYHSNFIKEALARNITVFSVRYTDDDLEFAAQQLINAQIRCVLGILSSVQLLMRMAQHDHIGPGYFWLLTDSQVPLADAGFMLPRETGMDLARAINGIAILSLYGGPNPPFEAALEGFQRSLTQQQAYIDLHSDQSLWADYPLVGATNPNMYYFMHYDAMIALGMAACEVPMDTFTGVDLYAQLLRTEFVGASGNVSFDHATGTRRSENLAYQVQNVLLSDAKSTDQYFRFSAEVSALIYHNNPVEYLKPFVFADNTTTIPPSLPPLQEDLNLIPAGARAAGLALGSLVTLASLGWVIWTHRNRKKDVVRSAQPFFLIQLGLGTLVMSSAVVPMSMQEPLPTKTLDRACMATPWLLSIGFVTAVSALFSKTWRLNKLFSSGTRCLRIQVHPRDVMLPILLLMPINLLVLMCWTIIAPLKWVRTSLNDVDQFGRARASYGACKSNSPVIAAIVIPALAVDLALLLFFTYQAYRARNVPTEFLESRYLTLSMASLLEISFLCVPLLLVGTESPTSLFVIRSILVSLSCLAIQLPIFVPKFARRHQRLQRNFSANFTPISADPSGPLLYMFGLIQEESSNSSFNRKEGNDQTESASSSLGGTWGRLGVKRNTKYYQQRGLSAAAGEAAWPKQRPVQALHEDTANQGGMARDVKNVSDGQKNNSQPSSP